MTLGLSKWDSSEHIRTNEDIRSFLEEIARDGDADEVAHAIGVVARALGMAEIARRAGCSLDRLYDAVNAMDERDPATITRVLQALGDEADAKHPADAAE